MKFQIPKAQDLSGKLASRTFGGDSKIMLNENDKMVLNNEEIAKEFNQYFAHITDSLNLYEFPDVRVSEGLDDIDNIVYKFRNHPSIVKIKERYRTKDNFSFRLATTEEIRQSLEIFLLIKQLTVKYQ